MSRDKASQKANSRSIRRIFQLRPAVRHGAKQAWQAAFIPDNWRFRFRMRKA
jgi:hypothetical protein